MRGATTRAPLCTLEPEHPEEFHAGQRAETKGQVAARPVLLALRRPGPRRGEQLVDPLVQVLSRYCRAHARAATWSASARHDVSPGDSMPNRFTSPGTPWSRGPCT